ncbi:hypothetical protein H8959_015233 [Pygathrix nigripes]
MVDKCLCGQIVAGDALIFRNTCEALEPRPMAMVEMAGGAAVPISSHCRLDKSNFQQPYITNRTFMLAKEASLADNNTDVRLIGEKLFRGVSTSERCYLMKQVLNFTLEEVLLPQSDRFQPYMQEVVPFLARLSNSLSTCHIEGDDLHIQRNVQNLKDTVKKEDRIKNIRLLKKKTKKQFMKNCRFQEQLLSFFMEDVFGQLQFQGCKKIRFVEDFHSLRQKLSHCISCASSAREMKSITRMKRIFYRLRVEQKELEYQRVAWSVAKNPSAGLRDYQAGPHFLWVSVASSLGHLHKTVTPSPPPTPPRFSRNHSSPAGMLCLFFDGLYCIRILALEGWAFVCFILSRFLST